MVDQVVSGAAQVVEDVKPKAKSNVQMSTNRRAKGQAVELYCLVVVEKQKNKVVTSVYSGNKVETGEVISNLSEVHGEIQFVGVMLGSEEMAEMLGGNVTAVALLIGGGKATVPQAKVVKWELE